MKAAGCTFHDVVDVTTLHTDPEARSETVMTLRAKVVGEAPCPSWTAVGVSWLSGFELEIEVIARVPS